MKLRDALEAILAFLAGLVFWPVGVRGLLEIIKYLI
jgi:hypothetical protein